MKIRNIKVNTFPTPVQTITFTSGAWHPTYYYEYDSEVNNTYVYGLKGTGYYNNTTDSIKYDYINRYWLDNGTGNPTATIDKQGGATITGNRASPHNDVAFTFTNPY